MGRPKKNKKAEIKARRKSRKKKERILDLRTREKRARAMINQILSERSEVIESLGSEESVNQEPVSSSSSSQDDQSIQ